MMKVTDPEEINRLVNSYIGEAHRKLGDWSKAISAERGICHAISFYGEGAMEGEVRLGLVKTLQWHVEAGTDAEALEAVLMTAARRLRDGLLYSEEWRPNSTSLLHNAQNIATVRAKQAYLRLINSILHDYEEVA